MTPLLAAAISLLLLAGACSANDVETSTAETEGTPPVSQEQSRRPEAAETSPTPSVPSNASEALSVAYGEGPEQFARLRVPAGPGSHPVVVLVHGGFWRAEFGLDLMVPLAEDLVSRGYATWNIEYRRVGQPGGGYPGTLVDVGAAIDQLESLAAQHSLDLSRVAVVGHSAGGHLALWSGSRGALAPGDAGADPAVQPMLVIGQAAVVDLAVGAQDNLGRGAVQAFLGGEPADVPEAYRVAQPVFEGGAAVAVVHGDADLIVPPSQSEALAAVPNAEIRIIEGDDHFSVINPATQSWVATLELLADALNP